MPPITTMAITSPVCSSNPSSGLTSWLKVPYNEPARPQIAHDSAKAKVL